ncbi:MAG: hypothetical protein JST42_14775, partial [Bacteroidetes bacterium]|nr:hypothetical protein [Bacteroidota bacterium]
MIKYCTLILAAGLTLAVNAQPYNNTIDVQHYDFTLDLNDSSNLIRGQATVTVLFRSDAAAGFQLDLTRKNETGKGMVVKRITEDAGKVANNGDISNAGGIRFTQ